MPAVLPPPLLSLMDAKDEAAKDRAWSGFLDTYSDVLLRTARRASPDHDGVMDRYTFMLDHLRQGDFRRLRAFDGNGHGLFTTWLVVVARRLCVDHHRHTHGRPQTDGASPAQELERAVRRNLLELDADVDPDQVAAGDGLASDERLVAAERRDALLDALATLDVADRLLLTLRFVDEVPIDRIAPMVGLRSRFQVHRRLKALLARLRTCLACRGFDGA